jgi:hypothetical protein
MLNNYEFHGYSTCTVLDVRLGQIVQSVWDKAYQQRNSRLKQRAQIQTLLLYIIYLT